MVEGSHPAREREDALSDPKKPLDRFQHLERERTAPVDEKVVPVALDRFGAVEVQVQPRPVSAPSSVERFGVAQGPDEVLLEKNSGDEQPFVKCRGCGTEAGKFANFCGTCGASFDTPEQREYNAQVWAERKAQLQAEHDAALAKEQQLLEEAAHRHDAKRAIGVAIAREIAANERERARIDMLSGRGGNDPSVLGRSPLLSLLNLIPAPWGWAVGGALALVPLAIIKWAHPGSPWRAAGAIWLVLDVLLLLPPSWWLMRRRRWWEDW